MRHEFMHDETGSLSMAVFDEPYEEGVPGMTIDIPPTNDATGVLLNADEVKRLYEITKSWLQRNTGAIL